MSRSREPVVTTRAVHVERIPHGTVHELPAGIAAEITQALGSSFTLLVEGHLVRLKGVDADAIGKPVPQAPAVPADASRADMERLVWQALRTCYDPEIPINIVELGLVYGCDIEPEGEDQVRVAIRMTLTAPGCGMGEAIANEVADKLLALPRVAEANVDMVFDPPWGRERLSEEARLMLGL
jgi:probable FeS assembly SUF system protein SufT